MSWKQVVTWFFQAPKGGGGSYVSQVREQVLQRAQIWMHLFIEDGQEMITLILYVALVSSCVFVLHGLKPTLRFVHSHSVCAVVLERGWQFSGGILCN